MRVPACGKERSERMCAVKAPQMGKARGVGATAQMSDMTACEQAVRVRDSRVRRMRKHVPRRQRTAGSVRD